MSVGTKVIAVAIIVFVVVGVAVYIGSVWGEKGLARAKEELRAAQEKLDELNGQVTSLNGYWANKEEEYKGRIASLNAKINERQREINGLKKKVELLEKQRAEIVIPQSPDLICPEFHKMGYLSCTRAVRRR
jgi:peptidoglycan hydrolase CwlO-like protein